MSPGVCATRPATPLPEVRRCGLAFALLLLTALALLVARPAAAAPEAHILRIDPRASMVDGAPMLTTVIELVQNKRMSDITGQCAMETGNAQLDCIANLLERPEALYSTFAFPEKSALLTVTVDGVDMPATLVSTARWGASKGMDGVGTAWLILVDATSSMAERFREAQALAKAFVDAMGPQDIVDVMFFNDRAVVSDSKWQNNKAAARTFVDTVGRTYPQQGRTRPLFNIIKSGAIDGFKELGNAGGSVTVPMHQAMVVLSNGWAGADTSSTGAGAMALSQFLTKGRFPEDNSTLPKAPVPVVSIFFPSRQIDELAQSSREFMEGLANPQIGGFFSIIREGQTSRVPRVVQAVLARFDQMNLVKWRVACVAPTINQTFKLVFRSTDPPIGGDNFIDVPVGLDPTTWPLDVDVAATVAYAKKNRVHPGGTVKIFGNFCWGSDYKRAQLYLIDKSQAPPANLKSGSIEEAKDAQKKLTASNLVGKAVSAGDTYVEFEAPDNVKFLVGKGTKMSARMVVYDTRAYRTSAVTADKILTLPAEDKPLNLWLIGGLTFGGVVLLLLVVQLFRGGGGGKRRAAAGHAAPPPVVAGAVGPAPHPPSPGPPVGAMLPGPGPMPPGPMPLGPMPPDPMPMPSPGAPPPPGPPFAPFQGTPFLAPTAPAPPAPFAPVAQQATLSGAPGIYPVTAGHEMRVGRDPGVSDICLTEPRVSAMHATLKLESGQLQVRDEGSNNGTFINGARIQSHAWAPVGNGAVLKFGPIEFNVRME
jgi:hypothetical protein